jgi:hypothetical protein
MTKSIVQDRDSDQRLHFKRQIFRGTMETTLCRLKQYFEKAMAHRYEGVQPSAHLLRCGTALAKSSDYLRDDGELPGQLAGLYGLSINGGVDEGGQETLLASRIQRFRFLLAYQKVDGSTAGDVGGALRVFRQGQGLGHLSGMPQSVLYEYIQLLAEMWSDQGDVGAYEILKKYVEDNILSLVEPHGEGRRLMVLGDMGELDTLTSSLQDYGIQGNPFR